MASARCLERHPLRLGYLLFRAPSEPLLPSMPPLTPSTSGQLSHHSDHVLCAGDLQMNRDTLSSGSWLRGLEGILVLGQNVQGAAELTEGNSSSGGE